jgi:uncharacterized protein (DUF302 family)
MNMQLGFEVELKQPYPQAIETVTAALKTQGFGVLTRIDVRATLKEKLNADFRPYVILGACNPPLAHQALSTDPWIGLLLPCNVTVEAVDASNCLVRLTDPGSIVSLSAKAGEMKELAEQGHQKMAAVAAALENV